MEEYRVKQLQPNHADHISGYKDKYLEEMFRSEQVIAQPKYDGERMLIHIEKGGNVYCTSRRFSKKTNRYMENQDKLPILQQIFKDWPYEYTVIDCECYSKDWSTVVGILHSLPERAIELQKENTARFAVFDCLYFDGKDLREESYWTRSAYAQFVTNIDYEPLHFVKFMNEFALPDEASNFALIHSKEQVEKFMTSAINCGFEGIVLKSFERKYYDKGASIKCKKFETVDCIIVGYQQGNGKYSNSIGALEIGYYDEEKDEFIKISKVNCGSDAEREEFNQNREKYLHTIVEVKCQEITEKSLRHPVFIRKREDKDYRMCTKETIFKN